MEDDQIIDLYFARLEQAIHETSLKYGKGLHTLSFRVVGDAGSAEECVNDTYMRTWNTIPPNEPRTYFFAYLARIVRGLSIDVYKKMSAQKRSAEIVSLTGELNECVPGADTTLEGVSENMLIAEINAFLGGLTVDKRRVFLRRYFYNDEVKDIGKRYGYSESKVKSMLMRLRKELEKRLEEAGIR